LADERDAVASEILRTVRVMDGGNRVLDQCEYGAEDAAAGYGDGRRDAGGCQGFSASFASSARTAWTAGLRPGSGLDRSAR
jgi:hypothetical protein